MTAFTVAKALLGDLSLTVGQLTQLRAIDHKYQQRLYTLLHAEERGGRAIAGQTAPTSAEIAELDRLAETDILDMLTPEQRMRIGRP